MSEAEPEAEAEHGLAAMAPQKRLASRSSSVSHKAAIDGIAETESAHRGNSRTLQWWRRLEVFKATRH